MTTTILRARVYSLLYKQETVNHNMIVLYSVSLTPQCVTMKNYVNVIVLHNIWGNI